MASLEGRFTFAVDRLSEEGSNTTEEAIAQRLDSFKAKYLQMLRDLQISAKRIEDASRYAEAHVKSAVYLHYSRKIRAIYLSDMSRIDSKILEVQKRLNIIRKQMPQKKHSLVESGPFLYKCVVKGAHYRDFPSTTAKVINDNAIACGQEVEIAERVFISTEQSVFLHCRGFGWLFENRREEVCFVRVERAPI
jgi:hypothetical protein